VWLWIGSWRKVVWRGDTVRFGSGALEPERGLIVGIGSTLGVGKLAEPVGVAVILDAGGPVAALGAEFDAAIGAVVGHGCGAAGIGSVRVRAGRAVGLASWLTL